MPPEGSRGLDTLNGAFGTHGQDLSVSRKVGQFLARDFALERRSRQTSKILMCRALHSAHLAVHARTRRMSTRVHHMDTFTCPNCGTQSPQQTDVIKFQAAG